jgi:hypothetical protein
VSAVLRLGGVGEAFADRNFRVYSVGSIISWITYFIQEIAFSWATWEATHSPAWLAAVALLTTGATILLAPIGGAFADRHDRFRLALAAYACDALKAATLTALAFAHLLTLPVLCAAALLHGIIHSFSIPAAYGLMPRFVRRERLAAAVGVNAAYTQFAVFAGPAIAGWLLLHGGVVGAFAANTLGYCVYFVTASLLRTPAGYVQPRLPPRGLIKDIAEGVAYLRGHAGLRALLLLGLGCDALGKAIYAMAAAFVALAFGGGPGALAAFYGAAGLGATAAALWIAHGGAARATSGRIIAAALGVAVAVVIFAAAPSLAIAVPAMALFGFAAEARRTGTVALAQAGVADAQRGCAFSTLFLFAQIAGAVGALAVGLSGGGAGMRATLAVGAAILAGAWLWAFARHRDVAAAFAEAAS